MNKIYIANMKIIFIYYKECLQTHCFGKGIVAFSLQRRASIASPEHTLIPSYVEMSKKEDDYR